SYGFQLAPGYQERFYTLPIKFGDQIFFMQFDTGSADLWVPEIDCTDCGNKNDFDPKNPTVHLATEHQPFQIQYGLSKVSGYIGICDFNIDGVVFVPKQIFGL